MPKPLRIFISSPGDVGPERRRAALVIESLKKEFARFFGISAYLWESEAMLATGHFQDVIEPPSASDIVVLILWSRLGTALPEKSAKREYKGLDGRTPVTGTEWEYEEALAANRAKGTPDLLAYRSNKEPQISLRDPAKKAMAEGQWSALEGFWQRYFQAGGVFLSAFHSFDDVEDFGDMLEAHLRQLIKARIEKGRVEAGAEQKATWLQKPFRGLSAYDFEHAPIFFGRGLAQLRAVERVVQNAAAGSAFLLVLGASGSGKSSLVRAGLLPNLFARGVVEGVGLWRRVAFKPGDAGGNLFGGLVRALVEDRTKEGYGLPELIGPGLTAEAIEHQLRRTPDDPSFVLAPALARVSEAAMARQQILPHEKARVTLVLDQLEEMFTDPAISPEERKAFVTLIEAFAKGGLIWVVATMRSDFWHKAAASPELVALAEGLGRMDLLAPSQAELAEMIRRPAAAAGLAFEDHPETKLGLDAVLAEEAAGDPGSLPLVSFMLDALYRIDVEEGRKGVLTYDTYEALGGLKGAIAKRAEDILTAQPEDVQAALPAVLRALVTVGHDRDQGATARMTPLEAFAKGTPRRRLVEAFLDPAARLLIADGDGAEARVRVAHESLINHWTRAREQIGRDRRDLETRARLEEDETLWRGAPQAQKAERLLDGLALEEGKDLVEKWGDELPPSLKEFIAVSREVSHAKRNRRFRVLTMVAAAMAVLAVAAGVAFVFALGQQRAAEEQRAVAVNESERAKAAEAETAKQLAVNLQTQAVQFAAQTAAAADSGIPEVELPIALEAMRLAREAEQGGAGAVPAGVIGAAQRATANDTVVSVLTNASNQVTEASFGPDPRQLLTRVGDQLIIWDAPLNQERFYYGTNEAPYLKHARDGQGRFFLMSFGDSTVQLTDWKSDTPIGQTITGASPSRALALEAAPGDGAARAIAGDDTGTVRIIDAVTGTVMSEQAAHQSPVTAVAISSGLTVGITADQKGNVVLWDLASGQPSGITATHGNSVEVAVTGVFVTPDGSHFATLGGGFASVFDASGTRLYFVDVPRAYTHRVAFTPDGKQILAASGRFVDVRDVGSERVLRRFAGHSFDVRSMALSRDGSMLVTGSGDNTMRLWDFASGTQLELFRTSNANVASVDISGDRQYVAGTFGSGQAVVWRISNQQRVATQPVHTWNIASVVWHPDGTRVLSGGGDGQAVLTDVATRLFDDKLSDAIAAEYSSVNNVAFGPDGTEFYLSIQNGLVAVHGTQDFAQRRLISMVDPATGQPDPGWSAAWAEVTPDGKTVLVAAYSGVQVFEADTGKYLRQLQSGPAPLWSVSPSPDGKLAAAGGEDGKLYIWDVATGLPVLAAPLHTAPIQSVQFSPDGQTIGTAASDGTVRITGIDGTTRLIVADIGAIVISISFSPDGSRFAVAGFDGLARVYDTKSGALVFAFRGDGAVLRAAEFSPDGKTLAAAGDDVKVYFFDLALAGGANTPTGGPLSVGDLEGDEKLAGFMEWASLTAWRPLTAADRQAFFMPANPRVKVYGPAGPCDLLAGWQSDPQRVVPGVREGEVQGATAGAACRKALEAEPGNARLRFQLGRALLTLGRFDEALKEIKAAADANYPGAVYYYGLTLTLLLYEASTPDQLREGAAAVLRAFEEFGIADAGDLYARHIRYGLQAADGTEVLPGDPVRSFEILAKAAEDGSWFASTNLAGFYETGVSVPYKKDGKDESFTLEADPVKALDFYALAAKQIELQGLIETTEGQSAAFIFAKRGSIARELVRQGKQAEVAAIARRVEAWNPR
jgi:WD40 repeat protein/tetratricopeptide (TPR) repeat protein